MAWFKADEYTPARPGYYDCLIQMDKSERDLVPVVLYFDRRKQRFTSLFGMIDYDNVKWWQCFRELPKGTRYALTLRNKG